MTLADCMIVWRRDVICLPRSMMSFMITWRHDAIHDCSRHDAIQITWQGMSFIAWRHDAIMITWRHESSAIVRARRRPRLAIVNETIPDAAFNCLINLQLSILIDLFERGNRAFGKISLWKITEIKKFVL
ncbi:hypothetical protein AVEN_226454-1 [Araneus ventricosus]|uniref:Uncharacterized protein n=1 Tax=Araneus ventricosus TaxID=182803 RepID=A0A4Y2MM63_ARAVE|nr:hypothetical protein AVEN_226454-1 [Araneus ventricosus]